MISKRKKLFISILLGIILTVSGTVFWSISKWYQLHRTSQSYTSDNLAASEGWTIYQSNGNLKVYQASIESFSIERAKLGPFAIGPLYVAHLKEMAIDLYAEGLLSYVDADKNSSKLETFGVDSLEGLFTNVKMNLLGRSRKVRILDIEGISLNLWEGERRIFKISSDRATIDRGTGDLIFVGHASLDAAENGNIISHRISWIRKTSLFRIDGPFILAKGNEKKEGSGLETDYLMERIKYQIKN